MPPTEEASEAGADTAVQGQGAETASIESAPAQAPALTSAPPAGTNSYPYMRALRAELTRYIPVLCSSHFVSPDMMARVAETESITPDMQYQQTLIPISVVDCVSHTMPFQLTARIEYILYQYRTIIKYMFKEQFITQDILHLCPQLAHSHSCNGWQIPEVLHSHTVR